jgi:hypothetical protein
MPFLYEKIRIKEQDGLEILGYEGPARKLNVPETIEGLPVISIGKRAFTDQNKGLEEITLPKTILAIQSFSFYFCDTLRKIKLYDRVKDYYDGAIRTSSGICDVEIEMLDGRYELIRRILDDSDRRMRILFRFPDYALQLVFPDYHSNSIEDTRAQTFHIRIEGSGFSYRECVRKDGIRIKEYDSLFRRALSADNPEISISIAAGRLMYPAELSETEANVYRDHLRAEMPRALEMAIKPENEDWPELFMREALLDDEALDLALQLASERKQIALTGQLMDYRNRILGTKKPEKLSLSSLDDFDF